LLDCLISPYEDGEDFSEFVSSEEVVLSDVGLSVFQVLFDGFEVSEEIFDALVSSLGILESRSDFAEPLSRLGIHQGAIRTLGHNGLVGLVDLGESLEHLQRLESVDVGYGTLNLGGSVLNVRNTWKSMSYFLSGFQTSQQSDRKVLRLGYVWKR